MGLARLATHHQRVGSAASSLVAVYPPALIASSRRPRNATGRRVVLGIGSAASKPKEFRPVRLPISERGRAQTADPVIAAVDRRGDPHDGRYEARGRPHQSGPCSGGPPCRSPAGPRPPCAGGGVLRRWMVPPPLFAARYAASSGPWSPPARRGEDSRVGWYVGFLHSTPTATLNASRRRVPWEGPTNGFRAMVDNVPPGTATRAREAQGVPRRRRPSLVFCPATLGPTLRR